MSLILTTITEAQQDYDLKDRLVKALAQAGVGEISDLWLASIQELEDMAKDADVQVNLDEAPISGMTGSFGAAPSMQNQQPMAGNTQRVQPASPGAAVNLNIAQQNQQANAQPQNTSVTMQEPVHNFADTLKKIMNNAGLRTDFERLITKAR